MLCCVNLQSYIYKVELNWDVSFIEILLFLRSASCSKELGGKYKIFKGVKKYVPIPLRVNVMQTVLH